MPQNFYLYQMSAAIRKGCGKQYSKTYKTFTIMRFALPFFFGFILLAFASCGGETPSGQQQQENGEADTTEAVTEESPNQYQNGGQRASHDCQIPAEVMEGNQLWLRSQELLVAIVADSTTYEEGYGPSHRILEVYNTENCNRIQRKALPVNVSPDFPYYLAEINYNNNSQLIAIRGFSTIYIYDAENRQLLPQLEPQFRSERYGVDAQSGMIQRLEVWEDYLVGYSRDYGSFVFDLENKTQPEPVLPFAEYEGETQEFYPLFLLESKEGNGYQAIMPTYVDEGDEFSINPAFEKPLSLNTDLPSSARNNRFLVLRQQNQARTPVALDLLERERVELPANIASQKTQDILNWMRSNS